MVVSSLSPSLFRGTLSARQTLNFAKFHLEYARKTDDHDLALVLCHDAEFALSHIDNSMIAAANGVPRDASDQGLHPRIEAAYTDLGKLQDHLGQGEKAQASHKIALKYKDR
jgi:hypothetical protein